MKRILYFIAAALVFAGCGNSSKETIVPTFAWEGNTKFTEMEIGKNMDAVVTADVPGGVSVFTVTANIPNKLVGMAEQYISISANRASESQLVFDFIKDGTASSKLKSFTSVSAGAKTLKMDFAKLLDALIGTAEVASGSKFTFKVHVEDASGNKKDCQAVFRWTAGPSFEVSGNEDFELGSGGNLTVAVTAPGKIEKLTLSFAGADGALSWVKKRTGGSTSVDIAENTQAADDLGFPTNLANATSGKLDFAYIIKNLSVEMSAGTLNITITVDDTLGKSGAQKVSISKK